MRCVNIYICGVTINGEKRLGGATNLKRGMLGLLNACEYVLWCSLVWSDEICVNKHIVMRHSFWNVFHGSHGSPPLLVFKHSSMGSCVNRAPPQSGSSISPPYTWMWMEQSSLQGVDPVPAREARQQGVITGKQRVWFKTGWKRNHFRRKIKYRGEALKRKERYGWGSISKSGSYDGKWICESGRGSPTKLHGIAIAVTAQDGSNLTSNCLPADVFHENTCWRFEFYFYGRRKVENCQSRTNGLCCSLRRLDSARLDNSATIIILTFDWILTAWPENGTLGLFGLISGYLFRFLFKCQAHSRNQNVSLQNWRGCAIGSAVYSFDVRAL